MKFFWFLFFVFTPLLCFSQEVVSSGGDQFANANGSFTFTIGEPVIETSFQSTHILTQGFQQNYESILNLQEIPFSSLISVYPNPFQEYITIDYSNSGSNLLSIILNEPNGKEISITSYDLNGSDKSIELLFSNLAEGIYFLTLQFEKEQLKTTYRIVKTQ